MSLVATPAVVLRTYRYSETSKVVRLATRDLGVQSAIAKGATRPRSPFGAGLELLSEGVAQLYLREGRELQTLGAFDVVNLRRELARDLDRFAGAAALVEMVLRMAPPAPLPAAYDTLLAGLDALVASEIGSADAAGVRALWRRLAARDYRDLVALNDSAVPLPALDAKHAAAHRRLVARFARHHSGEADRFPALEIWERHAWPPSSAQPVAS